MSQPPPGVKLSQVRRRSWVWTGVLAALGIANLISAATVVGDKGIAENLWAVCAAIIGIICVAAAVRRARRTHYGVTLPS